MAKFLTLPVKQKAPIRALSVIALKRCWSVGYVLSVNLCELKHQTYIKSNEDGTTVVLLKLCVFKFSISATWYIISSFQTSPFISNVLAKFHSQERSCQFCTYLTDDAEKLRMHTMTQHSAQPPSHCPLCQVGEASVLSNKLIWVGWCGVWPCSALKQSCQCDVYWLLVIYLKTFSAWWHVVFTDRVLRDVLLALLIHSLQRKKFCFIQGSFPRPDATASPPCPLPQACHSQIWRVTAGKRKSICR